jgi:hypothetical protein
LINSAGNRSRLVIVSLPAGVTSYIGKPINCREAALELWAAVLAASGSYVGPTLLSGSQP